MKKKTETIKGNRGLWLNNQSAAKTFIDLTVKYTAQLKIEMIRWLQLRRSRSTDAGKGGATWGCLLQWENYMMSTEPFPGAESNALQIQVILRGTSLKEGWRKSVFVYQKLLQEVHTKQEKKKFCFYLNEALY